MFLGLSSIIAASALLAQGPQDFGPLATRNHRAIALPFLRFEPRFAVLEQGAETALSVSLANDFRDVSDNGLSVREDHETVRAVLSYRQATPQGTEWGVELPFLARGGGFLDPHIDWWHANVLHWSNAKRDAASFGRSEVAIPGSAPFGSAAGVGDLTLYAARRVNPAVTARVGLKLPTGNPARLLGSGGVDAGLMVDWRHALGERWSLYIGAGIVAQSPSTALEGTRGWADQEYAALVHRANAHDEWLVQWQSERSPLSTGVPASDAAHRLVTFGYRRRLADGARLDLSFSEDRDLFSGRIPEGANIGPDFTFGVQITWKR